jgi:hypothetical protein
VTANGIGDDREHDATAIGVQRMAGGQVNGVAVVDRPAGRKPLAAVFEAIGRQVRNLFAVGIDHPQCLAAPKLERCAALRRDSLTLHVLPCTRHRARRTRDSATDARPAGVYSFAETGTARLCA